MVYDAARQQLYISVPMLDEIDVVSTRTFTLIDRLPITVRPLEVVVVCVITMAIGLIATIVPARRAAALPPVEGLRYD